MFLTTNVNNETIKENNFSKSATKKKQCLKFT